MSTLITVLHVLVCLFLMLTVLLQSGKGGMGAAFGGGGGTQTVFGGSGAGSFLRKLTVAAAVIFMLTSMTLAWLSSRTGTDALKRYSAQQRRAAQLKKQARENALGNIPGDGGVDQAVPGDGGVEATAPADDTSTPTNPATGDTGTDQSSEPAADDQAAPPAGSTEEPPPIEPVEKPAVSPPASDEQPRAPPAAPAPTAPAPAAPAGTP